MTQAHFSIQWKWKWDVQWLELLFLISQVSTHSMSHKCTTYHIHHTHAHSPLHKTPLATYPTYMHTCHIPQIHSILYPRIPYTLTSYSIHHKHNTPHTTYTCREHQAWLLKQMPREKWMLAIKCLFKRAHIKQDGGSHRERP